jgi:hypothetical protein
MLQQNAMYILIAVQFLDLVYQLLCGRLFRQFHFERLHPDPPAGIAFHPHICNRSRIVPDQNRSQDWGHTCFLLYSLYPFRQFLFDAFCQCLAIKYQWCAHAIYLPSCV